MGKSSFSGWTVKITSKAEFFQLWKAGVLGNRNHLFDTLQQAIDSGFPEIGFRELGKAGGGAWCKAAREDVCGVYSTWVIAGRKFIMDSSAPNEQSTLIGEICRTFRGLEGHMGISNGLSMRAAMKQGLLIPRTGSTILAMFEKYMDASSQDDIQSLLELYPDATIEFACFSCDVGIIPNRNTLVWEVRNY